MSRLPSNISERQPTAQHVGLAMREGYFLHPEAINGSRVGERLENTQQYRAQSDMDRTRGSAAAAALRDTLSRGSRWPVMLCLPTA